MNAHSHNEEPPNPAKVRAGRHCAEAPHTWFQGWDAIPMMPNSDNAHQKQGHAHLGQRVVGDKTILSARKQTPEKMTWLENATHKKIVCDVNVAMLIGRKPNSVRVVGQCCVRMRPFSALRHAHTMTPETTMTSLTKKKAKRRHKVARLIGSTTMKGRKKILVIRRTRLIQMMTSQVVMMMVDTEDDEEGLLRAPVQRNKVS